MNLIIVSFVEGRILMYQNGYTYNIMYVIIIIHARNVVRPVYRAIRITLLLILYTRSVPYAWKIMMFQKYTR